MIEMGKCVIMRYLNKYMRTGMIKQGALLKYI